MRTVPSIDTGIGYRYQYKAVPVLAKYTFLHVFNGSMLSIYQYEYHNSSQILHAAPLREFSTSDDLQRNGEQDVV